MLTRAALNGGSPTDTSVGVTGASLTTWRERCFRCQEKDLERALARFTFLADVTTLAGECRFAGDDETLVARYDGLPFPAISFHTQTSPDPSDALAEQVASLTCRMVSPGETVFCLVSKRDWPLLQETYQVLHVDPEAQMIFRGDPTQLDGDGAVRLRSADLSEMRRLARRENMSAFERDPLRRGPWYGVRRNGDLVAQGGTHLLLKGAAEIGNVVTSQTWRRQGYASRVVSALVGDLTSQGYLVFLHVLMENLPALALYEHLGFKRRRTMLLAQCQLR